MASEAVMPVGRLSVNAPLVDGSDASPPVLVILITRLAGVLSSSVTLAVALPLVLLAVKAKLVLAPLEIVTITVSAFSMIWSLLTVSGKETLFWPAGMTIVPVRAV